MLSPCAVLAFFTCMLQASSLRTYSPLRTHASSHCTSPLVFDVGMARTGTTTVCDFLSNNGYKPVHGILGGMNILRDVRQFIIDPWASNASAFSDLSSGKY